MSNLLHNWARQSRERRFRVNVLSPGPTRPPGLLGAAGPDVDQFTEAVVPLGGWPTPRKIAVVALFASRTPPRTSPLPAEGARGQLFQIQSQHRRDSIPCRSSRL